MALQSPEMRELYDLKVFVVSSYILHRPRISLMVELRFGFDVGETYNARYQRAWSRYRRDPRSGKSRLQACLTSGADPAVPPFRKEQL